MRRARLFQREGRMDDRLDLAASSSGQTFSRKRRGDFGLFRHGAGAQGRAGQSQALRQHRAMRLKFSTRAALGRKAICTSRPSSPRAARFFGEIGAADHVEDDIDAAPFRKGLRLGDEILRPVIDGEIGAERAAEGAFFRPNPPSR